MEEEQTIKLETNKSFFNSVTPFSKYLALAFFITMPFIGGWVGHMYAPEKVVEVERIVVKEIEVEPAEKGDRQDDWRTYKSNDFGFAFKFPSNWLIVDYDAEVRIVSRDNKSEYVSVVVAPLSENTTNVTSLSEWIESSEWAGPRSGSELWKDVRLETGLPAVQGTGDVVGSVYVLLDGNIYHISRWNGFGGESVADEKVFWMIANSFSKIEN